MNQLSYLLTAVFFTVVFSGLAHQVSAQATNSKQETPVTKQEGQRGGRIAIPEEEGSEIAALRRRAAEKKMQREAANDQQPTRAEKARTRKAKRKSSSN